MLLTIVLSLFLIATVVMWASIFEWVLHSRVMHKPVGKFRYAYEAHHIIHHGLFRWNKTYHLSGHENQNDKKTIPMAWWNWMILVPIASLPFIIAGLLGKGIVAVVALAVILCYYGLYEYFHWCMHLPKERRLERLGVFRRLNAHHLLHHKYMHKNFNVVFPFADLVLGTLVLRSNKPFEQPIHPSVPDVQPTGEDDWFLRFMSSLQRLLHGESKQLS